MKTEALSINPVWKECPPICNFLWLPAFETEKDAKAFQSLHPSTHKGPIFACGACDGFHYESEAYGPSGESSGRGRFAKGS
jgi:hypothetical protein